MELKLGNNPTDLSFEQMFAFVLFGTSKRNVGGFVTVLSCDGIESCGFSLTQAASNSSNVLFSEYITDANLKTIYFHS